MVIYLAVCKGEKARVCSWVCLTDWACLSLLARGSGVFSCVLGSWSCLLPACQSETLGFLSRAGDILLHSSWTERHFIFCLWKGKTGFQGPYDQSPCSRSQWGNVKSGREILGKGIETTLWGWIPQAGNRERTLLVFFEMSLCFKISRLVSDKMY